MNLTELWPLAMEATRTLGRRYVPQMTAVAEEAGLTDMSWSILLPALTFAPDPISPARLRVRIPYTAPRVYAKRLAAAHQLGLLELIGDDLYHLTEKGWQVTRQIISAAYEVMGAMAPLPIDQIEELSAYLHRLVLACLYADEPAGKWSLQHSRRTDPEDMAPPVIRIDQYLSDLAAFRDDAHLAAWKPHGVPGHGWEAFTLLWRGEVNTLDQIHEKLARRGYSADEYAAALSELGKRHWLTTAPEGYALTEKGRDLRLLTEDETDRLFFGPWTCLSGDELTDMAQSLKRLHEVLSSTVAG